MCFLFSVQFTLHPNCSIFSINFSLLIQFSSAFSTAIAQSATLYFFFALLIQRFPSANASLPYFAVISAFLFLNHFPFLLKSIKIAVMNISLIFTNRNAITAITFFCYSVSVKLFLLSIYFSITAILFCRKFQTGHAINSPVS